MILTCPRCATRYLVDPLQVWTSGRTVQCEACGQRWRAAGEGVRPAPETESPPGVERPQAGLPEAGDREIAAAPPFEAPLRDEADPVQDDSDVRASTPVEGALPAAVDDAGAAEGAAPVGTEAAPEHDRDLVFHTARRAWHATPPSPAESQPADEAPLTREFLFRKPPAPLTSSFASSGGAAGRWLAIAALLVIVLAAAVMFRDVIVQALPGLAPIYAAMGLLVHPLATPHG